MDHRNQRGRHVRIAQVERRGPPIGPLAAREIDDEGQHDDHRIRAEADFRRSSLCAAQLRPNSLPEKRNLLGSAMRCVQAAGSKILMK
jgi:hypothetical protein